MRFSWNFQGGGGKLGLNFHLERETELNQKELYIKIIKLYICNILEE